MSRKVADSPAAAGGAREPAYRYALPMNVCYLILAHAHPDALSRLLSAVEHPDSTAVVHVDARADIDAFDGPDGTLWLEDRAKPFHHSWGIVDATIRLLRMAPQADRYVLLSGDSYPLRSQERIREVLAEQDAEWLNLLQLPAPQARKHLDRLEGYYPPHDPRGSRVVRFMALATRRLLPRRDWRATLGDLEPWCGSQWWVLTAAARAHVFSEIERRPDFVQFCRHTRTPDEHFFHILLASNQTFRRRIRPGVMFTDFSEMPGPARIAAQHVENWLVAGLKSTDVYGVHPESLFARKVLDANIAQRIRTEVWSIQPQNPVGPATKSAT